MRWIVLMLVLMLVALAVSLSSCGELEKVPEPSAEFPNPPQPPIPSVFPSSPPTLGGAPSPPASPAPAPSATPTVTPPPASGNLCTLPAMPEGSPCREESPSFADQVSRAQAQVRSTRPDLFDGARVRSEAGYVQEVARVLRTFGLCAAPGGPRDEVAVKTTNAWNDQYDIVTGSGETWTNYTVTCRPSRF